VEHPAGKLVSTTATHQMAEFLLAGDARATAAARLLFGTESCKQTLALARNWKVIPPLFYRVQSLGLTLTAPDTTALRREFLKAYQQSAFRASKALAAIRGLQEAGIPVASFKGIASMAVLYGDPKHRSIHDADVLILPKDVARAVVCLEENGFTHRGSQTLTEYLRFVENSPGFAGNKAVSVYGPGGSAIDLHWRLAGSGLPEEEILQRAVTAHLMDSTIPVVDSKDGFLLTVHHAIRENLAIDSVCRDLLDVRLWCARLSEAGELEGAIKLAIRSGCQVAVLAVTSLLASYDATTATAQAAALLRERASSAERQSAARLIEIFHYQLNNGRLSKDVFYLVHSRPWRQILTGLGKDWFGYRQSMHTIEERRGELRPLPMRIALLAKSIPGVRGLRLARELAIIKYRVN
jgi:hypothetical protein